MKVNVPIEVSDDERRALGQYLTGNSGKALATRAQIREFVEGAVACAIERGRMLPAADESARFDLDPPIPKMAQIDPEDADFLADKTERFIRGWNTIKYRHKR